MVGFKIDPMAMGVHLHQKKKKEKKITMHRDASMYGAHTIRSITYAIPQVGVRQK